MTEPIDGTVDMACYFTVAAAGQIVSPCFKCLGLISWRSFLLCLSSAEVPPTGTVSPGENESDT